MKQSGWQVAVLDCDGDGRQDLYLAGGGGPSAIYRNVSPVGGALRFDRVGDPADDATPAADETDVAGATGAYPLDIDGDGLSDLAVLRDGENLLLRGVGGCRFERANERWGFDGGTLFTTAFSATWERPAKLPTLAFGNYVIETDHPDPDHLCADNELLRPDPDGLRYGPPVPLTPSGLWTWAAVFGANLSRDMTAEGLSGVASHWLFDDYWPGSTGTSMWKNVISFLTEAASCKVATPIYVEATELRVWGKGLSEYKKSVNLPDWNTPVAVVPSPFDVVLPFDVPFVYNRQDALLFDVLNENNPLGTYSQDWNSGTMPHTYGDYPTNLGGGCKTANGTMAQRCAFRANATTMDLLREVDQAPSSAPVVALIGAAQDRLSVRLAAAVAISLLRGDRPLGVSATGRSRPGRRPGSSRQRPRARRVARLNAPLARAAEAEAVTEPGSV